MQGAAFDRKAWRKQKLGGPKGIIERQKEADRRPKPNVKVPRGSVLAFTESESSGHGCVRLQFKWRENQDSFQLCR